MYIHATGRIFNFLNNNLHECVLLIPGMVWTVLFWILNSIQLDWISPKDNAIV